MACIDFLIWIGRAGHESDLDRRRYGPGKYDTINGYLAESRERGCCRRIPRVPSWFVPGESRAFLVYHNSKKPERGTLFGYYTIKRAEFVTAQPGPDPMKPYTGKSPWPDKYYLDFKERVEKCRGSDNEEECIRNKYSETYNLNFQWDFCKERIRFNGGPGKKSAGAFEKMTERIFRECINQYWEDFKKRVQNRHYALVPLEQSKCEIARGCGYRIYGGGIYLVNALAAEITDAFHKEMYRHPVLEKIRACQADNDYDECRNIFREVKRKVVAGIKPKYGEPELFNTPYPIYEKHPNAHFLNYRRIDGDELIERIKEEEAMRKTGTNRRAVIPEIPVCTGKQVESDKPMTKEQIVSHLAVKVSLRKTTVDKFFKELHKLIVKELNDKEEITLPDLGKMTLSARVARKGRNPQTGEVIDIPAKNVVRFRPAKALKDKVKQTPLKFKKKKKVSPK